MYKTTINGIKIKTNYRAGGYPLCDGNDKNGYRMKLQPWVLYQNCKYKTPQDIGEWLEDLVAQGYRTIMFREVSTMVRGCHDTIAFVKE